MKAYEILPPSMTGSAMKGGGDVKEPKPYEILPEGGIAAQGLVGWTKAASALGVFSKQTIGLPYDPAGTLPTQAGAVSRSGKMYEILPPGMTGSAKVPKPYEMMPAAGVSARGLGSKSGGCGGKPGGCGCGGKCGGAVRKDAYGGFVTAGAQSARRIDADLMTKQFLDADAFEPKDRRSLLKVQSLVADLPISPSLRHAMTLAQTDSLGAMALIGMTQGSVIPPSVQAAVASLDNAIFQDGGGDQCNYLRAKLAAIDDFLAAIDRAGNQNLGAIHQVIER